MFLRHHVIEHGNVAPSVLVAGGVAVGSDPDSSYTAAGLPPPPKDSTGNDRSDQMRKEVWAGGLAAAKACPACAPYIAVGLVVFEGWIRVGAFLSGESKDDEKYQQQAQQGITDFLVHGFIPRKWVSDVEFAADYAHYLGTQINALTLYPIGDTFVPELCTDFGLTMMELIETPSVHDRLAKGNASPFSGMVPDPSWRYGIYDSYPDADLLGLVATARFGGDLATQQARARTMVAGLRTKTWPGDPKDQAYLSANVTAFAWHAFGAKSRGFYLSASGARVDPSSGGLYKGPPNTPLEVMKKAPGIARIINLNVENTGPVFFASTWSKALLAIGALGAAAGWRYWPMIRAMVGR